MLFAKKWSLTVGKRKEEKFEFKKRNGRKILFLGCLRILRNRNFSFLQSDWIWLLPRRIGDYLSLVLKKALLKVMVSSFYCYRIVSPFPALEHHVR